MLPGPIKIPLYSAIGTQGDFHFSFGRGIRPMQRLLADYFVRERPRDAGGFGRRDCITESLAGIGAFRVPGFHGTGWF